jgi:hypothetical protein
VTRGGGLSILSPTTRRTPSRSLRIRTLSLVLVALSAASLGAQEITPPVAPAPDTVAFEVSTGVGPGGAFLRAVLVPGWGHASIGAYGRGGFYLAWQSATAWMLLRTSTRIQDARRIRDLRERNLLARLEAEEVDPADFEARLADDDFVADARSLVAARKQQYEDWAALGIFLTLLGGADAFVSAHLKDFPGPIQLQTATGPNGRVEVGVRVPLGGR